MKYTFSKHAKYVMVYRGIKREWIDYVLSFPTLIDKISGDEMAFYGMIQEYGNRCLKVALNPKKKLIITVYFDRGMRKRGCK